MGRYGIQVSQQGIPVERAADYQMVLDSNWKFLDVAYDMSVDMLINITGPTNGFYVIPIFQHSLGYLPAFEFMVSSLTADGSNSKVLFSDVRQVLQNIRADSKNVFASFVYVGNPISIRLVGRLRVFALDILTEYQAPTVTPLGAAEPRGSRYGAKFLDLNKGNGDIEDETMYPFTLNTRGKQISIHKHGTKYAASSVLTLQHDVGYPPTFMLAKIEEKSAWQSIYPYPYAEDTIIGSMTSSYFTALVDPVNIEFRGVQSSIVGRFGYIILKDPAEIAG